MAAERNRAPVVTARAKTTINCDRIVSRFLKCYILPCGTIGGILGVVEPGKIVGMHVI